MPAWAQEEHTRLNFLVDTCVIYDKIQCVSQVRLELTPDMLVPVEPEDFLHAGSIETNAL